jgi:hypothetical protein
MYDLTGYAIREWVFTRLRSVLLIFGSSDPNKMPVCCAPETKKAALQGGSFEAVSLDVCSN